MDDTEEIEVEETGFKACPAPPLPVLVEEEADLCEVQGQTGLCSEFQVRQTNQQIDQNNEASHSIVTDDRMSLLAGSRHCYEGFIFIVLMLGHLA